MRVQSKITGLATGMFLPIVVAMCLSGCSICGGISCNESEAWLSNFIGVPLAHGVCYHEKTEVSLLVALVGAIRGQALAEARALGAGHFALYRLAAMPI